MTDYFEKGFRGLEEQYVITPRLRKAIARMRAEMYQAEAEDEFPKTLELESHEKPSVYIHPNFDFRKDLGLVIVGGENLMLTPTECRILGELSSNPNVMVPRANLLRYIRTVNSGFEVDQRVVAAHISHIRGKIDLHLEPGSESAIRTIRNNGFGSGYMLIDSSRAPFVSPPSLGETEK